MTAPEKNTTMLHPTTPTTPDRHQHQNDMQLVVHKRTRPAQFQRLLDTATPAERADIEARVARAEQREQQA